MKRINKHELETLRNSGSFDANWYLEQYPDVQMLGMDPLEHYLWVGRKLRRRPSPSSGVQQRELASAISTLGGTQPSKSNLKPNLNSNCAIISPHFDEEWYLAQFGGADVPNEPLEHFEQIGWRLGLSPNRWFDTIGYVAASKDVARANINPFVHFIKNGRRENRSPNPLFVNRNKKSELIDRNWDFEYGPIKQVFYFNRQVKCQIEIRNRICVHFHAYYTSMIPEITIALKRIPKEFTLLVSVPNHEDAALWKAYFEENLVNASKILVSPVVNRGRDVAPWLTVFRDEIARHDLFFHFHTKRSHHASEHRFWFRFLIHTMIGSRDIVEQILETFETDASVGLIAPAYWPELRRQPNFGAEEQQFRDLCRRMNIKETYESCPHFPAGSFFWCKVEILERLFSLNLSLTDFPEEEGQVAGTLAHAIERIMGALPMNSSRQMQFISIDRPHDHSEHQSIDIDAVGSDTISSSIKVSVVMPTWNRRSTILMAIRSALGQSYSPYEIIVADDGSTDGTLKLIRETFPQEINNGKIVIVESGHLGVSFARNSGLDICKGDVISYLDSDNTWREDYLKNIVYAFEAYPFCLSVYTDFLSHDADLNKKSLYNRSYDRSKLIDRNFIDLNVFSHRRKFIDGGIRFDTNLKRLVDWDLIIRITSERAPLHVKYVGADYHLDKDGLNNISRTVALEENLDLVSTKCRKERVYWGHDKLNIVVKCPAPNESVAHQWGDYHFARSLCRSLERLGCRTRIDLLCDWDSADSDADDVVLVLRGLSKYRPKPGRINLIWMISHPDKVDLEELKQFDHVFVASNSYFSSLVPELKVNVSPLLQCSDLEIFYNLEQRPQDAENDVVFVGNSRGVDRWMPKICADRGLPIQVYGAGWEGRIPHSMIKGNHVANDSLGRFYGRFKIVLNDHWPDMAKMGFISNRVFDVGLSGSLIVSDRFNGSEIFFGNVVCCENAKDVEESIRYYLENEAERLEKVSNMRSIVRMNHTFEQRADEILKVVKRLVSRNPAFPLSMGVPILLTDNSRVH